jgi:hypothetical protein
MPEPVLAFDGWWCVACWFLCLPADTENKFVSTGFAEEISKAAGGEM